MSTGPRPQRSEIGIESDGHDMTLQAAGVIDHAAFVMWDRCVSDVMDAGPAGVILDLAGVTVLASSGMRLIVDLRQQLAVAGIKFAVANVPTTIGHLLELTGMADATAAAGEPAPVDRL